MAALAEAAPLVARVSRPHCDSQICQLFVIMDQDGNGRVDTQVRFMIEFPGISSAQEMVAYLDAIDDVSGTKNYDKVEELIASLDFNGDGQVTVDDFARSFPRLDSALTSGEAVLSNHVFTTDSQLNYFLEAYSMSFLSHTL